MRTVAKAPRLVSLSAQVVVLALIAAAFFMRTSPVAGLSMEPRVHPGELLLINTLAYRLGPIRRGDVVAFRHDAPNPETYIKRIVGLPGERVEVREGTVRIDGRPLAEPYVRYRDRRSAPALVVPPHAYYVLGDNRSESDDSRDWGVLHDGDVSGRAILGLWPLRAL
jgi:signal peptidase I